MNLEPQSDRVLLKKIVVEQVSEGGIILAADSDIMNDKLELLTAEVLAVGEGKIIDSSGTPIPTNIKVGDIVLYNPSQALEFSYLGKQYLTLRASEIPYKVK